MNVVIDASVAGAAGKSTDSCATRCRVFLECFKQQTRHQIVFTPKLKEEWARHRSVIAFNFRASMVAQRRVRELPRNENTPLRRHVGRIELKNRDRRAIERTCIWSKRHRLEGLDRVPRRSRAHPIRFVGRTHHPCAGVVWANPDREHDAVLRWIKGEAPTDLGWRLGAALE